MTPPEISVTHERGPYAGGHCGISFKVVQDDEILNEIFVYDQEVAPLLAELYRALTSEQRTTLSQIIDAEEVA